MAGVAIPVIIHLWNDRRGKVLFIGSVALLAGVSRRAAWSPRLTQLWLLLLRCLLVIALAVLLAGPYFFRRASGSGWVLIAGHHFEADSLVKAGFERHVLDSGVNYWEAFRRADSIAPVGVPFFVFTPGLLSGFGGTRPVTGREVHWKVYPVGDSVSDWVDGAYRVSGDSILVVRGLSRGTGTYFQRERVADYEGIVVDTAALKVSLVGSRVEAKYMRAALKALGEYTGRRIREGSSGIAVHWRPEWEGAAWDGRLPVVLGELIFHHVMSGKDRRVIDPDQVTPVRIGGLEGGVAERLDLRPAMWVVLFVLFVLERIKVFRDGRQKA